MISRGYRNRKADTEYEMKAEANYIDMEEKKEMEELQSTMECLDLSDIKNNLKKIIIELDDPWLLEDILGYARHVIRRYQDHEDMGSYEGLGVDYDVIEPEVEEEDGIE